MQLSPRLAHLLSPARSDEAVRVLQRYFTPGRFTGAHFERFAGGGDRPSAADEFTADDLVAVTMLSVSVEGNAALEVLEHRRNRLRDLLRRIPTDVALADLPPDALGDDWVVRQAFSELRDVPKIGTTTATKLLARKRPHLVPIVDSVIEKELCLVGKVLWAPLHTWLTAGDCANHRHLLELRDEARLDPGISALRVFDVLTWMVGKGHVPEQEPEPQRVQDRAPSA